MNLKAIKQKNVRKGVSEQEGKESFHKITYEETGSVNYKELTIPWLT